MVGTVAMGFVGSSPRMAVRSVEVKDAPIEGIRLEMAAGRTVKGSITMEGGGPVPRSVYVFLTAVEGGNTGFTPNVGGDGKFTIANVFPLTYVVNVQNLPANCYVKAIRYGQDVPRTGLEITGEAELEVVLGVSAAVLEGSVTGADGKPAGNAAIVVEPVSDSWPAKTGNADGKGNFYFANLPPGEYRVIAFDAESPQAADPPESLAAFAALAKTVKLAENAHEKVQVTVVPAGR
jgi:hypothetical protein